MAIDFALAPSVAELRERVRWCITGADGAAFTICMARIPDAGADAATMFLVDSRDPGQRVGRPDTLDAGFAAGHYEMHFQGCTVPASAVLGEVGKGCLGHHEEFDRQNLRLRGRQPRRGPCGQARRRPRHFRRPTASPSSPRTPSLPHLTTVPPNPTYGRPRGVSSAALRPKPAP